MPVLRFAVFELDPEAGELRRRGRLVRLAAQPLKVLVLLARRPGQVVTRDELRRHVWGEETFVEFDHGLNFCIASIRSALNDDARSPRFIETLPRRGYRFLAEVNAAARGIEAAAPRRARLWAGAATLLLLLAVGPSAPIAHTRANALPEALAALERAQKRIGEGSDARRRSIYDLREAIRLDPSFAEAHWMLGDTYLRLAADRELPAQTALAEARAAALRAVALEPMPETKQLSGLARLLSDWDWTGAERDLADAVRLAPSWDGALTSYARFLSAKGDDAGALAMIDRAETVSPSCDLILFDSGVIRYRARRYEEAMSKLDGAERFGPPRHVTSADWRRQIQAIKIRIRARQRLWAAARQEALVVLALNGVAETVKQQFESGDPEQAVRLFFARSAVLMSAGADAGRIPPTRMASVYATLGQADSAMKWLERAAAEHDPDLVYDLRNPEYDEIRSEPRFRALEERVRSLISRRT